VNTVFSGNMPRGFYRMEIQVSPAAQAEDILAGSVQSWVQTSSGPDLLGINMIQGYFDNVTNIKTQRSTFSALMYTNSAPEVNRSGQVACRQIEKDTDILQFLEGDVFTKVVNEEDSSGSQENALGLYKFYKRTSESDDEMRNYAQINDSVGLQYFYAPLPWEYSYIVTVVVTPQVNVSVTTAQAGKWYTWDCLEYTTPNKWVPTGLPTITKLEYDQALAIVNKLPDYYTNAFHLSDIWNKIKQVSRDVVQGTIKYAPKVASVIAEYGPKIAKFL